MRKLPKAIQNIIKKKMFSLNTTNEHDRHGVDITYRIQRISTEHEKYGEKPYDKHWSRSDIYVNLVVYGEALTVEPNASYHDVKSAPIKKVAKVSRDNSYRYSRNWGFDYHKKIREHIRRHVSKHVTDYLKLFGLDNGFGWSGRRREIVIKNITWG